MERICEEIQKAVLRFDREAVLRLAEEAVAAEVSPLEVFEALRKAIVQVGEDFASGRAFLPELVGSSRAMEGGMTVVQRELARRGEKVQSLARIALGTVQGDIHSIGKNLVAALLAANGAEVIDLGINVPSERFIETVRAGEVDVLGLSALLTTTMEEQKKVLGLLEKAGLRQRIKVMVGGGAITQIFADEIGADGYGSTAAEAVELVRGFAAG